MKDSLERGIEKGLVIFVDAWVEGRYARATLHGMAASIALDMLADRRGLLPEERQALLGGEAQ